MSNSSMEGCCRVCRVLASAAFLLLFAAMALGSAETAKQLQDPNHKVREKAAKELGEEGNPENVAVLATAIHDKNDKVRMAVVKSLIHLGTPASLPPLEKAVSDGIPEIRSLAIDGLVNFYLPGFVDTGFSGFFHGMSSKVEGMFYNVDTTMVAADVKPDPGVVRTLAIAVNGAADMQTRVHAARALGILRAQDAVPDLIKASFSNNVDVINTVLIAFQKIKDTSVGPRIAFLLKYPQKSVQENAATTLGLLRTKSAIPQLEQLFQSSGKDKKEVREAALDALAFMPAKETAPLFLKYLDDKDKKLRASSAMGLGRLKDPSYVKRLQNARAAEKDKGVRLALDFALVENGKMQPLQELVSNLTSRVHRGEARPYLIELAREKVVRDNLRTYLFYKDPDIRENLCIVYGASGDASSIPDLQVLERDRDADVAQQASRAIRLIHSRGM